MSRSRSRGDPPAADRGSATAETAVVLPVLALVLLVAVWAVLLALAQLRCVDAAGTAARALARDEPAALVLAAARSTAPPGSRVTLARGTRTVTVTVETRVGWPGSSRTPSLEVSGRATAAREDVPPAGVVPPP